VTDLHHEVTGDGPAVVFLHEGFVDSRSWDAQVPALAERFTVIRYDQRGYGRSPRWDGAYSNVDDLRTLLDSLGVDRAALVAASRGGRIAIEFALAHPERVSALVLVASGLRGFRFEVGTPEQEARWEEAEKTGDLEAMADIDLEVWAPLGDAGGLRQMALDNAHTNLVEDPEVPPEQLAVDRLAELRVPTLVITGNEDVHAMDEIGDKLEREIAGARRVRMSACDHFPAIRKPDEFNRLLADFLLNPAGES
jgi:pimeloyl-ACP methyl ester carboxylesterase